MNQKSRLDKIQKKLGSNANVMAHAMVWESAGDTLMDDSGIWKVNVRLWNGLEAGKGGKTKYFEKGGFESRDAAADWFHKKYPNGTALIMAMAEDEREPNILA